MHSFSYRAAGWNVLKWFAMLNLSFKMCPACRCEMPLRFCVCYKHKELQKLLEAMLKHLLVSHGTTCIFKCLDFKDSISFFLEQSLCPAIPGITTSNSSYNFYAWSCINLQCPNCWRNKQSHLLNCPIAILDSHTGNFNFVQSSNFPLHLLDTFLVRFFHLRFYHLWGIWLQGLCPWQPFCHGFFHWHCPFESCSETQC